MKKLWFLVLALFLALVLCGCQPAEKPAESTVAPEQTEEAEEGQFNGTVRVYFG